MCVRVVIGDGGVESQGIGACQQEPIAGSGYLILTRPDQSVPGWVSPPGSPPRAPGGLRTPLALT